MSFSLFCPEALFILLVKIMDKNIPKVNNSEIKLFFSSKCKIKGKSGP